MTQGPDITRIAMLIGDPARANMLLALMDGRALTAGELAEVGGISAATASGHLAQLVDAGLLWPRKQGRHRYFALADADVAHALETLDGLAAAKGHMRHKPGPKDAALREARICYDHLAGAHAVRMFDCLASGGHLTVYHEDIGLTAQGATFIEGLGIDVDALSRLSRPLCRVCLDWSERRSHLAGALGAALLARFEELQWLRRSRDSRHVTFTPDGARAFAKAFS
ncbi:winged helix-turn-helix domain-containing protein [Rhodobacteraceae bacterium N5(2021)]|uniref:Winged helix-turn-helix domain-containing protein n=1 Tax=Gymnodinialimonas phycosphaerae TaxID=2841589 RepID=A0A975TU15_9RHOB|nr:winged helix-turn-helix domain-containing protein [Gymnodinialimonas phycosphaerae]MBY4894547.1 winged helix-turn-helix domain-containing protein [Gymnodinialimonas phycosphaerae]